MMKKVLSLLLAGAIFMSMAAPSFAATATDSVKIYVSAANGDDAADGATLSSAVKTPARAQELARAKQTEGKKTEVIFEEGEYLMDEPLAFTSADSGTADSPVVYRAYQGANVKFSLAKKLTADDFTADSGNIMVASLDGMTLAGDMTETVYQLGEMQTIATYTENKSNLHATTDDDGSVVGYSLPESVQESLSDATGLYWGYKYNSYKYNVESFDSVNKLFQINSSTGVVRIMNAKGLIDEPGEYYVDAANSKLYYYPKYDLTNPVYIASNTNAIITVDGVSSLRFEGIDLFCGTKKGIEIKNSSDIVIYDAVISGFGDYGIYADKTTNLLIASSSVSDLKSGGILVRNADTNATDEAVPDAQLNLVNSENVIRNTKVFDYDKLYRSAAAGMEIGGIGVTVQNCEIHTSPINGINYTGNDHIIENNKLYNLCLDVWDAGAIYSTRSWINRGTVIRNNYIYQPIDDVNFTNITAPYWYNSGTDNHAIYVDDLLSGITVENNIVYNLSRGILVGGGSDNTVTDNVVINSRRGIQYDNQGAGGWRTQHIDPNTTYQGKVYKEVKVLMAALETASDEVKAKWNAYPGFSEMIARVEAYDAAVAAGTDSSTALKTLGAVNNRTVSGNVYTGNWANWWNGSYVPEGGENATANMTWTDSNGEGWKYTGSAYQLKYNDTYVGANTHISMATAADDSINDYTTAANRVSTNEAEGITIANDYTITIGERTTADMGVKEDEYIPSYSADEDGVNAGNKFTIVAAVYDASGALKSVNTEKEAYMYDGQLTSITVDVPDVTDGDTADWNVKVFLWDSIMGLTPVGEQKLVLQ